MTQIQKQEKPAVLVLQNEMLGTELREAFKNNDAQMRKEVEYAIMAIQGSKPLQNCAPESIRNAVFLAGRSGLTLNPMMSQSYLIPRFKNGAMTCCWEPSYQGLITKMVSINAISRVVSCEPIYENDIFEADYVEMTILSYMPYSMRADVEKDADGRKVQGQEIGAFVKAVLPSGEDVLHIRGIDYINDICDKSESVKAYRNKSATDRAKAAMPLWLDRAWRPQMIRKTMLKLLWGQIPKSENENLDQMAEIVHADNNSDPVVSDVNTQGAEAIRPFDPKRQALAEVARPADAVWEIAENLTLEQWVDAAVALLGEKPGEKKNRPPSVVKRWLAELWLPYLGITMDELNAVWAAKTGKAEMVELPLMALPKERLLEVVGAMSVYVMKAMSTRGQPPEATEEEAEEVPGSDTPTEEAPEFPDEM